MFYLFIYISVLYMELVSTLTCKFQAKAMVLWYSEVVCMDCTFYKILFIYLFVYLFLQIYRALRASGEYSLLTENWNNAAECLHHL